jgi:diphosphomevalonate decarboxylase
MTNTLFPDLAFEPDAQAAWSCPSNIALVKYWGKKAGAVQWPANASISWALGDLRAQTRLSYRKGVQPGQLECYLDGQRKESFEPKIKDFFQRVYNDETCSGVLKTAIDEGSFRIDSSNNFPHGTGIASSAAGFGALALCLADLQQQWDPSMVLSMELASRWARLGSGSACRSLYKEPAIWGLHSDVADSSDDYAVPHKGAIASSMQGWKDCVLIVDAGEKSVSSTQGHALLNSNAYAHVRFDQAQANLSQLLMAFEAGDAENFMEVVESEALQLHAMMMVSKPSFVLMRPGTLAIIEAIRAFRAETGAQVCFTLDAGANVHMLFAPVDENRIVNNLLPSLLLHCQDKQYLCTALNRGPEPLKL